MLKLPLKTLVLLIVLCALPMAAAADSINSQPANDLLLPPNAKAGECYARVFTPPVYRTETETLLKREASHRIELIPARYEQVQETVLVREESKELEVVPATYEWVAENVMVKPERKELVEIPARYETVTEQVLDVAAHEVWKRGRGPVEKIDHSTGEIMCRVTVPASYKTVSKQVLSSPARVEERTIPAEYKTIKRRVMATPPTTREITIPAEYKTVTVTKMVSPPQEQRIEIPAEYQTVTRQVMVSEGGLEWQPVLCETNLTKISVKSIQRSLRTAGYSPGSIDGVIGSQTLAAIRSFQSDNGLATGGLTIESVKALERR